MKLGRSVLGGNNVNVFEMICSSCFEPDRLPDTRRARIEDALGLWLPVLFASRDRLIGRRIFYAQCHGVAAVHESVRNIKRKRYPATFVRADILTIHPDPSAIIHRAKVQQNVLADPVPRSFKA